MRFWTQLTSLWRTVVRGHRLDTELDVELQSYLDEMASRKIAAGVDPATARREAALELGGVDQVKERVREVRIGRFVDEIMRDTVYACRMLRRAPGFSVAAVATLALGVGAVTAIFSVVNALLIAPLPYADPARLVFIWADQSNEGYPRAPLSGPELVDLDTRTTRFDGFGAIWASTAALTGESEPEQLRVGLVTPDFFAVLGAHAALGRTFVDGDVVNGPPAAILISSALWQRRYGGDTGIVGKRILVNGQPATVIGVMPSTFRLLMPPDASVPDDLEAWLLFDRRRIPEAPRGQRFLRVIGRVRADASMAEAHQDVTRVGDDISTAYADYGAAGRKFEMIGLQADAVREIRGPLLAAFGGVGILLLIAGVNVASLLIARAAARSKETALRIALGAGHGRLLRQHLVEGLLLTMSGAAIGLLVGRWGLAALLATAPPGLGRLTMAKIDVTVIGFSVAVTVFWGMLLSLTPLSEVLRLKLASAIRIDTGSTLGRMRGGLSGQRLRSGLITAQVALSVVLVVGALLLMRTVDNIQRADVGFSADGIYSFRFAPRAPSREAAVALSRRLQTALAEIPGIVGAASLSHAPYDHVPNWGGPYLWEASADSSTAPQADYRSLSPGAIELLGIRVVEGRSFSEDDDLTVAPVVIVDRTLADRAWPGTSPIGRRLGVDPFVTGSPNTWATVVGVVDHVRHRSLVENVREQVYFAQRQVLRNPSVYIAKAAADPAALMPDIRDAVRRIAPATPMYDVRALSAYGDDARATRAFTMRLAVIFAMAALGLAAIGIYGVIAYSVALRHREFGVRQALGARASQVVTLVAREGVRLVFSGVMAGIVFAAVATYFMRGLLFGVGPWDVATFAATVPVLLLTGAVACIVPARRASAISPAEALRVE